MGISSQVSHHIVIQLYKDCLLMARFLGQRQGNEKVLLNQIRVQFKANMKEVDDDKLKEQKEAAIRALHNLHLLEAERFVKERGK